MADPAFRSPDEFRTVMDRVFSLMDSDPAVGPRLRLADVPERFEFTDLGLVLNVRPTRDPEEGNLRWEWSDEVPWEPRVCMTMDSPVANRYFQGHESVAMALARRRIRTSGDLRAALDLLPIVQPVFAKYRALVESEFPHLLVRS